MTGLHYNNRHSPVQLFAAVLFHEFAHSTGHGTRLARPGIVNVGRFWTEAYAAVEMIADLAAALLCAHAGITLGTKETIAAYIRSWLEHVKEDRGFFPKTAGTAQKAADLLRPLAEQTSEPETG